MVATPAIDQKQLGVFISYSRKDVDFAQKIVAALEARGLTPRIDTRDLPKLEDWRRELLGFIREADAVVFIVSPNSILSPVCAWEVEQVAALNKRLAPIVLERVSDDRIPEAIARINYLFFDKADDFDARVDELAHALQTDLVWLKEHTRVGELARRWDERNRPGGLTLRGQELQSVEHWIASRPRGAPEPTALHKSFVAESRRAATRRLRLTVAASLAVGVLALGLAAFAVTQRQLAEASRSNAVRTLATSDFRQGTSLLENNDTTSEGMALLSRSVREGQDKRALARLWTLLQQRRFWLPAQPDGTAAVAAGPVQSDAIPDAIKKRYKSVTVNGASAQVKFISVSGDGKRIFTAIGDNVEATDAQYRIWRSDGTPVTPWIKPPYNGTSYVASLRGYLSLDGNLLALDVTGWRETAYLQIIDLKTNQQIGSDVRATGRLPNSQNVQFSRVQFLPEPAHAGADSSMLLFTVSEKGDAVIFRVDPSGIDMIAKSEHAAPIVFAELDAAHEWLMTSSSDGILRVTRLAGGAGGELIGNVLHLASVATSIKRVGNDRIVVTLGPGNSPFFALSSVVKMPLAGPVVSEQASTGCKRWDDGVVYAMDAPADGKLRTSKGELSRPGPRQLAVVREGGQVAVSPVFSNEVILVCLGEGGDSLAVTTSDFVTEVWTTDFSRRLGLPIVERRLFGQGTTPQSTKRVFVPRDNRRALIASSLWDPPNVDLQWYSLWDLETGLPLMDRTLFENTMGDDEVERAMIDPDAKYVAFTGHSNKRFVALASLDLTPPETVSGWLPDLVEALGGLAINNEGAFEPVPDRPGKIRQGFENIRQFAPGVDPGSRPGPPSGRSEAGPVPNITPSPVPPVARVQPDPRPIAASQPPASSYDPVGTVRAFYLALSRADGDLAQTFVIPEKRGSGPFNPTSIRQFYSNLPSPMETLSVELASNDVVNVKYRFVRPNGSECRGNAAVTTTFSGGKTLIRGIAANC
ncbi:toll/interleukin-1 receptor domain-containing protein [Bradyrhizobium septentrionale]|uniref:Toll/interleukin-1 receptor domain-containing protein n=1 Tax=Bradyrhizobium septentrionale TaxID=1404411 RepID=A0A973VV07_9BRAD|nr:toll/interleukin-1 receptor domain-containing protein [Bradyrhizobium septentrionale]UGY19615.1 toll/interleukin-1 receptor domain-containing protein [Bradyrhizobium septentrionale]